MTSISTPGAVSASSRTASHAAPAERRVVRARAMGTCFGVRDALAATRAVAEPSRVTIWGELVHNPAVVGELAARGFHTVSEQWRAGPVPTPEVLITAHGVSDRDRARLQHAGHRLLDTTCPLVRRAHDAARELAAEGRHIVVIGRRGHVEVRGLTGDLPHSDVVWEEREVARYPYPRLGVVAQTTTPPDRFDALLAEIRLMNPDTDLRVMDTICAPTRDRQLALDELAAQVRVAVVVGGPASNNTLQLVRTLQSRGVRAHRAGGPEEVDVAWFTGEQVVGLTAGTSALPEVIAAVERAIVAAD